MEVRRRYPWKPLFLFPLEWLVPQRPYGELRWSQRKFCEINTAYACSWSDSAFISKREHFLKNRLFIMAFTDKFQIVHGVSVKPSARVPHCPHPLWPWPICQTWGTSTGVLLWTKIQTGLGLHHFCMRTLFLLQEPGQGPHCRRCPVSPGPSALWEFLSLPFFSLPWQSPGTPSLVIFRMSHSQSASVVL